jgi:acetoacetate decarboxylase
MRWQLKEDGIMEKVSFVMTPEEIKSFKEGTFMTKGACLDGFEGIYASWVTNPDAVKRILPPPLQFVLPVATIYIANVSEPNYALPYMEGAICVPAVYDGVVGLYFAGMLLTGPGAQMATFLGREGGGISKKFADDMRVTRMGNCVKAYIERDGVRIIDVEAEIGQYNTEDAKKVFGAMAPGATVPGCSYLFKFDFGQSADGKTCFTNGRLRRSTSSILFKDWEPATAKVTLMPSINDPWAELGVVQVLGAGYTRCDMHLIADNDLAQVNADEIMPYLMKGKFDSVYLGKPNRKLF